MDLCPICHRMTAERNPYTKELLCYNRSCDTQAITIRNAESKYLMSTKEQERGGVREKSYDR